MQEELLLEILNVVKRSEAENKKAIEELKTDLKEFKEETRTAIEELKTDLKEFKEETRTAINELREETKELRISVNRLEVKIDKLEERLTNEMNDTSQMVKILFEQTDKTTKYLGLTWDIKQIN